MDITLFDGFRNDAVTGFEKGAMIAVLVVAVMGLLYAWMLTRQIMAKPVGNEKMQKIAKAIRDGGNAYLKRQFKTILLLIVVLAAFIFATGFFGYRASDPYGNPKWLIGLGRALGFLLGAGFSATVGYIGMNMAMQGNIRVAEASRTSFIDALKIAYRTGTITGMLTDGLGLLGGTLIFIIFFRDAPLVLLGFGFGGTLIALFMRVGGGIYTKAADVGADLVGKVEKDIPEDDPRNAAVIADLVGDNVGDCAGMAADIFESYEVTIVSAMILGLFLTEETNSLIWIMFPLLVRAAGVFSSIISTYTVGSSKSETDAMKAIHRGYNLAAVMSIASFALFGFLYCHDWRFFAATSVGVVLAVAINQITDYYTGANRGPVTEIRKSTKTGPATTILSGLGIGLESSVGAILIIAASIAASALIWRNGLGANDLVAGAPIASLAQVKLLCIFYGVALCGIGQLTLTGNNISMDAFGPVSDNANGIGEMAGLEPKARQTLADLDAVGNTTKAITKGIAIASAVLAAVALFASFKFEYGLSAIDMVQWKVFVAFLIGGAIPFLFSSLLINAVGRAAYYVVNEVRWQFANIKGIWEGTTDPDYEKVVTIVTSAAQKELLTPALIAIVTPIVIGFVFGLMALAGFLAGVILVGQLMAVFQSNAGGAWDNAKKTIEDEPRDLAKNTGKGSERHKASVVGDTIGDPLKDTSGPALNPLIKVINLVSVIAATVMLVPSGIHAGEERGGVAIPVIVGVIGLLIIIGAFYYSKTQKTAGRDESEEAAPAKTAAPPAAPAAAAKEPPKKKH
jgi:K(+)-stimulated pyrophosphate-energized sodium pump